MKFKKGHILKRYLNEDCLNRFLNDFKFLFEIIKKSYGEYDIRLRDNYFNIYYQGNSLAKINFESPDCYKISVLKKFIEDGSGNSIFSDDLRFKALKATGEYEGFIVNKDLLHPFFQVKYIKKMASRIVTVNNGEEITFEQMLITDNLDRDDLFIIDRQVMDQGLKGRMDLLALKQVEKDQYQFLVLEVKLGKNNELKSKVVEQIGSYVNHINNNFTCWKESYEKTYEQLKMTGIYQQPSYKKIQIVGEAKGCVVVGGYSGIADIYLGELKSAYPFVEVKRFKYEL